METIVAPIFAFLFLAPIAVYAATFQVDWSLTTDYSSWPSKAVNVGDQIVFTYDSTHSVYVVSETGYANCDTSNPSYSDTNSPTTYKLKEAGPVYFICGTPGHCPGMQLQLNVKQSNSSTKSTPPSISTPASPPTSETPTPSTSESPPSTPSSPSSSSSSSPPPPPTQNQTTSSNNNAVASDGFSWLVFGILLIFGTLFLC